MNHTFSQVELARRIQHTLIDVGVTRDQITAHALDAQQYGFHAAMVPASWVGLVVEILAGSSVRVATALDFPTVGVTTSAGKAAEAESIAKLGAHEIDMGVQVGWLKSGMYKEFRDDIAGVVRASGLPVKVMLELPLLTPSEREVAVELSVEAGAAYLKNASSGKVEIARPESISFLVERAPVGVHVKASGGITNRAQVLALLAAGASLVGTSAGIQILTDTSNLETTSY